MFGAQKEERSGSLALVKYREQVGENPLMR